MTKFYKKNGLVFAIFWIVIYVVGLSIADNVSVSVGIEKSITVLTCSVMTVIIYTWIKKNDLLDMYGLCKCEIEAKKLLYYVPLIIMASVNLWFGVAFNLFLLETVLYILSMLMVGFLEEIIFRGFLFVEMCKDNVKTAIIVSSVTFGIGHIVNLINGSGADLFSNILQVIYAIAGGFLFTILFYKTKSLWACIITHIVLNALSVFANESAMTQTREIVSAGMLTIISVIYAIYILRRVE
jgi:membrane protease YdiL (CAAX protease family)